MATAERDFPRYSRLSFAQETNGVSGASKMREARLSKEELRTTVIELREIKVPAEGDLPDEQWQLLKRYTRLLKDESNIQHFTGIAREEEVKDLLDPEKMIEVGFKPKTGQVKVVDNKTLLTTVDGDKEADEKVSPKVAEALDLKDEDKIEVADDGAVLLSRKKRVYLSAQEFLGQLRESPKLHWVAAINGLGEEVGFALFRDPGDGQHDAWIERLVIENSLQNVKGRTEKPPRVGKQFLAKINDYGFTKPTKDEVRTIHAAVVLEVAHTSRVRTLFKRAGYTPMMTFTENARVLVRGEFEDHDVQRFQLERNVWKAQKAEEHLEEHFTEYHPESPTSK